MNEDKVEIESLKQKKDKQNKKNSLSSKLWYFEIFVVSLSLCFIFAIMSQLMLMRSNLVLALFVILVFIFISVIFDVIGVAVAASHIKPFLELKSKGYKRGVDQAIKLVKNADRVSSVCTDVIGDICSILSGAGGVAVSIFIVAEFESFNSAILSTLISSLIAALTVLGKALGKTYALNCSTKVLLVVGKFMSIFSRKKGKNH